MNIPLADLHPRTDQPRQHFDREELDALAQDILAHGLLNALIVRRDGNGGYEILAGHRRHRAMTQVGIPECAVILVEDDDRQARERVLKDNLHRADFMPWEEGAGYRELLDLGYTVPQIAEVVTHPVQRIKDRLLLADNLSEPARQAYLDKDLTLEALNYLAKLPNRQVNVKECRCGRTSPDGELACLSCGAPLPMIPLGGNPQLSALPEMRGKLNGQVADIFARFQTVYCLGRQIRQDAMSLEDQAAELKTVEARDLLDKYLAAISRAGDHALEHAPRLAKMTAERKATAKVLLEAARRRIDAIDRAIDA